MSTKFHLAITTDGQVVEGFLSGGNVNDVEAAPELVREVAGWRRIGVMTATGSVEPWRGTITFRSYRDGRTGRKR
jgi:hypothetical protein